MAIDVYAPCPCGSGKKLKFCCAAVVDDMAKVRRLQASDQPRQACQILEKLEKAHPDNPWVVTTHAEILIAMRESPEAKQRLERLLAVRPDNPSALAALALAALLGDGYDAARPAIHRAYQKCITRFPKNVGLLTLAIASLMEVSQREMAARQYLALAMRLMEGEAREEVFLMLWKLDGNTAIAYPLRSVHKLGSYDNTGENVADAAKGNAFVGIGCWGPAARAFARVAEREPQNAAMWRNAGLCRAWDGDESGAAEALHRAADASHDFAFAVECETMAQLFDLKTGDPVSVTAIEFPIRSASRVLGLIDGADRISAAPPNESEDVRDELHVAGEFVVYDKPLPADGDPEMLTADQIPVVAARLTVFDSSPDEGSEAAIDLRGYPGETFDGACDFVENLTRAEIAGPGVPEVDASIDQIPREHLPYMRSWVLPPNLSFRVRHSLAQSQWQSLIDDVWMNSPQSALGGSSPLSAVGKPEYRVRLAAAVYVLDALAQRIGRRLDIDSVFGRLSLEPLAPLDPADEATLSSLSPMQLHRVPVSRLSDGQLVHAHRRAMLIGHRRFVQDVLNEILSRPQVLAQVDADQFYGTLTGIARDDGRLEDAIALAVRAKDSATKQPNAFEQTLSWTILEFRLRAEQDDDPELPNLYRHLTDYYAPKVPQLASMLEAFRRRYADRYSWLTSADLLLAGGAATSSPLTPGSIWTPTGASPAPGPAKLWLPGQE